ncbi:MAG: hypothetical protein FD175_2638, partial [Beijerinckiaceae bacterium]
PEMVPIHPDFLSEAVNHTALIMPTILWVWALVKAGQENAGQIRILPLDPLKVP